LTIVMSTTMSRNPVQRTNSESQREFFMPDKTTHRCLTHR